MCDPVCDPSGDCSGQYEPGGGVEPPPQYPVIGTVVANPPATPDTGLQTGLWTGSYGPTGGYMNAIPQHGWGPYYQFQQSLANCGVAIYQVAASAGAAAAWCVANAATVGTMVALASERAMAALGRGAWALAAAAEFFGAIITLMTWPIFISMCTAVLIGLGGALAVGALIQCEHKRK